MSFVRTLVGIWKSYEETSEDPKLDGLKTRYYNKSREKIMDIVQKLVSEKMKSWKVTKVDVERGEIVLDKKQGASSVMIVTVYKMNPVKSAVDVYCSKQGSFGDFGSSYKHIVTFLLSLDKKVEAEVY